MQLTKEEYGLAKLADAILFHGTNSGYVTSKDLINLIEDMREAVGIAAHPDAYENWEAMLADAISALPAWILDR